MSFDIETISQYAVPAIEIMLILSLFWVASIFLVLDKKLNAMKSGTDGIRSTIVELNQAIERAQASIYNLKTNTKTSQEELAQKIEEAKMAGETLAFLNQAAKALNTKPQNIIDDNDLPTTRNYNGRRRSFEDLPAIDPAKRNVWGGLR